MPNITEAWLKTIKTDEDGRFVPADGTDRARYFDEQTPGFGVVVGRRSVVFVVRHRLNGKQCDRTIGQWQRPGAGDDHGDSWTETRARKRARSWLGMMDNGIDPYGESGTSGKRISGGGPTLRDAFEAHKAKLKKKGRSEQTITTLEKSMAYVETWLDKPIAELTGTALVELHEQIKKDARPTKGAKNEKGAPLANRVITNVGTAWATLNKQLQGKLGNWNPAKSVDKDKLKPRRTRVDDLARWAADVATMRNPIQRDGLVFALFTGLRNEDVRTVRHEHVDLDAGTLRLVDPKGGEDRAFTIPLPKTCIEIVERRIAQNTKALGRDEGDGSWLFPGVDSDGAIGPIGDLRQQVHAEEGHSRFPVESVHDLRRTYLSVAHEAGVSEIDQHVLTNHSFGSHNVNATYISQHIDHLRGCQDRIEAALKAKIKPPKGGAKGERSLRAV